MLVKLDENLGERARQLFMAAEHQVATFGEQGLAGAEVPAVIEACSSEGRCLVTLDLDFSNPFRFPPDHFSGIAVLRLPRRPAPSDVDGTLRTLIAALALVSITGKLWIVERHRVRKYSPDAG
jgi:predicted nuclease of predicted toxin-antitoxin system